MVESSKPRIAVAEDADQEAVAVMVHGTFAADSNDEGEGWWQADSPVTRKLQALMPSSTRVAEGREVFHWSGENSDRARFKAAAKLLRHAYWLEDQGRDYHLVGHSHGGSVIWNALQMSMLLKRPLQGLRSWTTVGTPFMQHRSPGAVNLKNLFGLVIGLALLLPAFSAPKQLVKTLYNVAVDNPTALVLDSETGYATVLRAPVLAIIECFGIVVERSPQGVQIGSFDPAGSQPLGQYFFATPEGLFLLMLMVSISYFCVHCAALCIAPILETFRVRLEQRLHRRAFEYYRARWLGLWSPDDEAINGLRATLQVSVSFVKKMVPRDVVFLSDMFGLLSRPYFWLFAPLYNRFVHPTVDGKIRNVVIQAAQGSDRPGAQLIDVTPCPMASESFTPPPLPALLNVKLLSFANRHAHEIVPKLRQLIARTSFTSGLEDFGRQLSGKELVHTAYFEQEEVLRLIAANIHWTTTEVNQVSVLETMPPWLRKWFVAFKQGLEPDQQESPTPRTSDAPELPARKAG